MGHQYRRQRLFILFYTSCFVNQYLCRMGVSTATSIKRKARRLISCLLAIYLFNISVDFQHSRVAIATEDISINEIESIAELLIEELAHVEGFFEEQAESDCEPSTHSPVLLDFIVSHRFVIPPVPMSSGPAYQRLNSFSTYQASLQILTPPPRRS